MRQRLSFLFLLLLAWVITVLPGGAAQACDRPGPLVSTEWLEHNLGRSDLVILDLRAGQEYATGHVPGAINIPFAMPISAWNTTRNNLLLELPDAAGLFATLGAAGIQSCTQVVLVNNTELPNTPPSHPRAQTTRVALTLAWAGVKHVSILSGGFTKWALEGRPLSTDAVTPTPVTYDGQTQDEMFVPKSTVEQAIGDRWIVILDTRDTAVYNGSVVESYAPRPGHIPSAKSLPAPQIWNDDGTYKSEEELRRLAAAVVGNRHSRDILVYCGVGGYASAWWFVLTQVLGYRHVKVYDGSAQEWVADPNAPLELSLP